MRASKGDNDEITSQSEDNYSKKVILNWQKLKLAYNELGEIYKKNDEIY